MILSIRREILYTDTLRLTRLGDCVREVTRLRLRPVEVEERFW